MGFQRLNFLALNNNNFQGSLPEVNATELVVLALHKNHLSGVLPSLLSLQHLGVLTLHENSIGGSVNDLSLSATCIDNSKFKMLGMGCVTWKRAISNFKNDTTALFLDTTEAADVQELKENCPSLFGCPGHSTAYITLHRNRFSCKVPAHIAAENVTVAGLVIMGNMLGFGHELNSSWILPEEKQSFLYYSGEVWKSNRNVLYGFLVLLSFAALCYPRRQRLQEALWNLDANGTAWVASSHFALIKASRSTCILVCPLLVLFWYGGVYYECSPPLWQTTAANLKAEPLVELAVIACWCVMLLLFRSLFASMPKRNSIPTVMSFSGMSRTFARRILVWLLWVCMVTFFSLPSVLYAFAQSLPAHNTSGLSDEMLNLFHGIAPALTVLIDMVLAVKISVKYSKLSGANAEKLLMTFRLFSAWMLPLLITVVLDENCIGGWKWTWTACRAGSSQHKYFDWRIYDEEILNTEKDICSLSETWWLDGRCSRAIVGNLAPFLLQKLLVRSTVQPLVLWLLWRVSRLESHEDPQQGRHLKLFGSGPKTSGSLQPLQQMSLLTTQMEILAFWTPFIPLLSLGILGAGIANLLIFDLGVWGFGVKLPSDEMNQGARLSRWYLLFALCAGCCFQLWHAFSTGMYGRSLLLAFSVTMIGPWAKGLLPVEAARRHFWKDLESANETRLIEMGVAMFCTSSFGCVDLWRLLFDEQHIKTVLAELGFPEVDLEVQKLCSLEGFSCDAHQRLVRLDLRPLLGRARRVLVWLLWVFIVATFSLPSVLYAFAQSLPAHNTSGLDEALLKLVHGAAPALTVLIDMVLAVPVSAQYSFLTGVKTDRLLMTFRLFSAWLLPVLITVILDENCLSGWKWTWTVCQEGSAENQYFYWSIYGEEILNTRRDICNLSQTWWSDGCCSRAIVGNLTPFLLKKLLVRSSMQPLISWLMWRLSRLEHQEDPQKGRHLKLFGFGPKTTSSLHPLQQMSLLTTQMELLAFWTPFIPLLSLGILGAGTANLLIFDLGVWVFRVKLPSDEMNRNAGLSRSYLSFALIAGCCFQLWHAFSTQMYGRYVLLIFSLAVMGPWAKCLLPIESARGLFWADAEKASETEFIEMAIRMDMDEAL
ncbi:Uncharacterized protein SCF082_LOCUS50266 [Durusdinium trenchii]